MKPIHFSGLNCYHDCLITIASALGVEYPAAFATLWSETDFSYVPSRGVYLSKRLIANLEALGAKVADFDFLLPGEMEDRLSLLAENELAVVGMDAFFIPWNQLYQTFHGPHYFVIQNVKADALPCVDPTYQKDNERIARQEVIAHGFDLSTITRVPAKPSKIKAALEAREVLRAHSRMREGLLSQIRGCANEERQQAAVLAQYVDALIRNRYLYRFFWERQQQPCGDSRLLMNSDFFGKWMAVKNGLLKASISKDNQKLLQEVCGHLHGLMDAETAMAERMAGGRLE